MAVMNSITLENYRCFREKQTVRLAPLTLLVGENSTGKSSFLALIHILTQLHLGRVKPDFKAPPFDLGSFDDIAHTSSGRSGRADHFSIGCETPDFLGSPADPRIVRADFTLEKERAYPALTRRRLASGDEWIDEHKPLDGEYVLHVGTKNGSWQAVFEHPVHIRIEWPEFVGFLLSRHWDDSSLLTACEGSPSFGAEDADRLERLLMGAPILLPPYPGAPVRSRPRRTYDPDRSEDDPEGKHTPMYLAELARQRGEEWKTIKSGLEAFGRNAGLFDGLDVRLFSPSDSDPFQLHVRQSGKGTYRNLIDVGYGVSQALPLVTDLLRPDSPQQFLLQQPEVHLHPSAQAALGSLFCEVAADGRQLIVETHSDHLLDRVRMDVRDGKTELTTDDVRILYFERDDLDVKIHELWWDENGNIENAPPSYRRFFMEEVERSIWPPD